MVGGAVESACVFGVPDAEWGEVVAAAVTGSASSARLRESLRLAAERLARHERPRAFVRLDDLPRTESGKVDRLALARVTKGRLRPI